MRGVLLTAAVAWSFLFYDGLESSLPQWSPAFHLRWQCEVAAEQFQRTRPSVIVPVLDSYHDLFGLACAVRPDIQPIVGPR